MTGLPAILTANAAGLRHGYDQMWSYHTPVLQAAYSLGQDGCEYIAHCDSAGV